MAEVVRMPKMSDTMEEGVVAKWHKAVGDKVKSGDLVAEIETDKATMEFESYQEGTLLYLGVKEGASAPVNSILAILGEEGEDYKSLLEEESKEAEKKEPEKKEKEPEKKEAKKEQQETNGQEKRKDTDKKEEKAKPEPVQAETKEPKKVPVASSVKDGRIKASPLAKKLAGDKGIDLTRVQGSGEHGRIVKRDIDWYKPQPGMARGGMTFVGKEDFEEMAVSQMRKTIAKRLAESKFTAPHFYLTMEIDMERMVDVRQSISQFTEVKISYNDYIIKAVAMALRQHPKVNSAWLGDSIRINHHINIGVAVAVEEGLLVPVVRFADGKTLTEIATEVKELAQKAKDKKLQPTDWEGNTFTISNLGMFGIEEFTAIINPPDACILAVGAIKETPVVKEGQIVPGKRMKITLSCDHRAVDGAVGSAFLKTLKEYLENPVLFLGMNSI
jgi:pyruvate dehydrogenase E2 component (dihydrolipoamide acetyltransferase)